MGVAMAAAALASAASGMTVAAPRKAMAYNKLGSSDLMVSSCCLGTRASSKVPLPTAAHAATCRTRSPPVLLDGTSGARLAAWVRSGARPKSPLSPPHGRAPLLTLLGAAPAPPRGAAAGSGLSGIEVRASHLRSRRFHTASDYVADSAALFQYGTMTWGPEPET